MPNPRFYQSLILLSAVIGFGACSPKIHESNIQPGMRVRSATPDRPINMPNFYPMPVDTTGMNAQYVGQISLKASLTSGSGLPNAFQTIRERARGYLANVYRIENPPCITTENHCELILSLYRARADFIPEMGHHDFNTYYFFGVFINKPEQSIPVLLDDLEIRIRPMHYVTIANPERLPREVSVGGSLAGSGLRMSTRENPPVYVSVAGASVRPGVSPSGGVGIRISSGTLTPMSRELGLFLMTLLHEQPINELDTVP